LHGQQNQHNLGNSAATNSSKRQQQQQQQVAQYDYGANHSREPMLAFFGVCIPFGPPSLLEMPSKDSVFTSKHRLDLSIIKMDSRGKQLLDLNDLNFKQLQQPKQQHRQSTSASPSASGCSSPAANSATTNKLTSSGGPGVSAVKVEQQNVGSSAANNKSMVSNSVKQQQNVSAYDLVHHDDLSYMASAHQELLKTGASGLIAYRMINQQDGKEQWLQTSAKLYYKNSKPDFIHCTHRPLMEEEGRDLLGKRTMDFKITYLDVGLSSINDRIMACDKFSSLQALSGGGNSSSTSTSRSKSPALVGVGCGTTGSPALSAGESSRSLASMSPQSQLNESNHHHQLDSNNHRVVSNQKGAMKKKHASHSNSYDLTNQYHHHHHHHQQQHSEDYDPNHQQGSIFNTNSVYDTVQYKRAQNGDIFYDMDTTVGLNSAVVESVVESQASNRKGAVGSHGKKKIAKGTHANGKQANNSIKKQRDLHQQQQHLMTAIGDVGGSQSTTEQLMLIDAKAPNKKANKHDQVTMINEHQQQLQQQQVGVDPQKLHLYSHYTNQHHHLQSSAEVADSYPAIQAAAVYAASLGHHHHAHAHHHHHQHSASIGGQSYAGSTTNQHVGYSHHHNGTPQSLYGSAAASMVSPTTAAAAAYSQHQHHSQLHLDGYHQVASSSGHHHYATLASQQSAASGQAAAAAAVNYAAASSFLPSTEHLLHHYSQSAAARSAAALAAWPTSGPQSTASSGSVVEYSSQHHPHHQASYASSTTGNTGWGASAAAAAAAALVASASGTADLAAAAAGKHQDQATAADSSAASYSPNRGVSSAHKDPYVTTQHYQQQLHHQSATIGESTSPCTNKSSLANHGGYTSGAHVQQQRKAHQGPASLASDGSAHRSPLSSSDSSNGSGSLTAAATSTASATASTSGSSGTGESAAATSMISPNAYYVGEQQQHLMQHQQQHNHHHSQQQPTTAGTTYAQHHHNFGRADCGSATTTAASIGPQPGSAQSTHKPTAAATQLIKLPDNERPTVASAAC